MDYSPVVGPLSTSIPEWNEFESLMEQDHILQIHRQKKCTVKTAIYHREKFRTADKKLPNSDKSVHHKIVLLVTQCSTSVNTGIVLSLLFTLTTQEIMQSSTGCDHVGLTRRISAKILCPIVFCELHGLLPSFLKAG